MLLFGPLSFSVTSAGCHVFLPLGAELLFPPGCVEARTRLKWARKQPCRKLVRLEEHHVLLSWPLELLPHGITFLKVWEKLSSITTTRISNNTGAVLNVRNSIDKLWML